VDTYIFHDSNDDVAKYEAYIDTNKIKTKAELLGGYWDSGKDIGKECKPSLL